MTLINCGINLILSQSIAQRVGVTNVDRKSQKMHDAAQRPNRDCLLERRTRCESEVRRLLGLLGAGDDRRVMHDLVVAIVEWRSVTQALALTIATVTSGDAAGTEEAEQLDSLCCQVDQLTRLCFEFCATTDGVGDSSGDEFNQRQALRCVADSRRDACQFAERFCYSTLVADLALQQGFGKLPAAVDEAGERRDQRGSVAPRARSTSNEFYDSDDDGIGGVGPSGLGLVEEDDLFGLYWSLVEKAEFEFDDVQFAARPVEYSGGRNERLGRRDVYASEGATGEEHDQKQPQTTRQQTHRQQRARLCCQIRHLCHRTAKPRARRGLDRGSNALRSLQEVETDGMRTAWVF